MPVRRYRVHGAFDSDVCRGAPGGSGSFRYTKRIQARGTVDFSTRRGTSKHRRAATTEYARVAQLVAQLIRNQ